jgi:2,4-dienoyl-CoA reductase-like NADH-dependent reductase (Old Yellow Enzyme family)
MCQYSANEGVVGQWHLVHLGSFATGGAGLVMADASAVTPEGRISIHCPGLWNEEQARAWRVVTDFVHSQDTKIGIQLAHAGRKGSTMTPWDDHLIATKEEGGWTTLAPSPLAFEDYPTPHELNVDEIATLTASFANAADRAVRAGFDVLEIHAAHGYLLHEFLSPLSNERTDEYGGSFENRIRLLVNVVIAVRGAITTEMPLFVRISATDYVEGGWDLEQSIELARVLKTKGVDLIDVSSGGNVHGVRIRLHPGYQVDFAQKIRSGAQVPTSAVGLITEPQQAENIIMSEQADATMLARAMLRNPRWALNAAEELGEVVAWPPQLDRARTIRPSTSFARALWVQCNLRDRRENRRSRMD